VVRGAPCGCAVAWWRYAFVRWRGGGMRLCGVGMRFVNRSKNGFVAF